jgi:hypothetical protein
VQGLVVGELLAVCSVEEMATQNTIINIRIKAKSSVVCSIGDFSIGVFIINFNFIVIEDDFTLKVF